VAVGDLRQPPSHSGRAVIDKDFPLFELALLKGLVEHNDGTAYFGSLGGYQTYLSNARTLGWVSQSEEGKDLPTESGRLAYGQYDLSGFTNKMFSRAYTWNWDCRQEIWRKIREREGAT
jgi:hypothetical protein